MTHPTGAKAHAIVAIFAAAAFLAAASAAVGGVTATRVQPEHQTGSVSYALRCQAGIAHCMRGCRSGNHQAALECRRRHGVLQEGSCKPNTEGCSCWTSLPACTPRR